MKLFSASRCVYINAVNVINLQLQVREVPCNTGLLQKKKKNNNTHIHTLGTLWI